MKIRIAGIVPESIVDGPGIRYTVFTQGCPHHCFACHNPDTHDFNGGYLKEIDEIINDIKKYPFLQGITISGGEPFIQTKECYKLVSQLDPNLDVIIYTGFTYETLLEQSKLNVDLWRLLNRIDYLIDGRFEFELKDLDLMFRGSRNQRIIDVKKSLLTDKIILKTFGEE